MKSKNFYPFGIILFLVFFTVSISTFSQTTTELSDEAQITLLTASPGNQLYSVFGHSAIRVTDPVLNTDLVFNYGTFDFDTPNFYLKFVRGQLLYKLSVVPMEYFMAEYRYEGRAVYEQLLDLSQDQKQRIYDFLMINRLPQNAYYHYDFFYDNCATRIRDLIDWVIEPEWATEKEINQEALASIRSQLNYEFAYNPPLNASRTFRDMLQPFLEHMKWSAFGIDLALGLPADKIAASWDYMFLPDELLIAFALAYHEDGRPLVSNHRIIIHQTLDQTATTAPIIPELVFWLLFIISLLVMIKPRWSVIFDRVFFSTLGILGIAVLFLWFFTDHITTKSNLNILWALPTHLYYIWFANYDRIRYSARWYFRFVSILTLLLIITWFWIPQDYHQAFFPVVLAVFIKSSLYAFHVPVLSKYLKKN
jgi:hypothetical protein